MSLKPGVAHHCVFTSLCIAAIGLFSLCGVTSASGQTTANPLYTFTNGYPTGVSPSGTLIQDSHGAFYGVTNEGKDLNDMGLSGNGIVYRMTKSGAVTPIYNFSDDNAYPVGQLAVDSYGNLYGTASGGFQEQGYLYKLTPSGSPSTYSFTKLHSFGAFSGDGLQPESGVYLNGNVLYGTTESGGTNYSGIWGTVWSYNLSSHVYTILHNFFSTSSDGLNPSSAPILGSDGRLYGVTLAGGSVNGGTIYSMNTDGSNYDSYSFTGAAGGAPVGRLVQVGGIFYGVCYAGGSYYGGIIFQFTHSGSSYNVTPYYSFDGSYGAFPNSRLTADSSGNLYGVTYTGGWYNVGAAFMMPTSGARAGMPVLLHSFDGLDGYINNDPEASGVGSPGLILASDGSLYGVSSAGGITYFAQSYIYGNGAAFKITTSGKFTSLASFGVEGVFNDSISNNPGDPGLVQANDGYFYGTAINGGPYPSSGSGDGAIYRTDAAGNVSIVHYFNSISDGSNPTTTPLVGQDGALYGQTSTGGYYGAGTIWRCTTGGSYSVLYNVTQNDGGLPGTMFQSSNKILYGCLGTGGAFGDGDVFSCTASGVFTILHHFNGIDGYSPVGIYYQDGSGYLYGLCNNGGSNPLNLGGQYVGGTLWKMKTDGSGFTVLHNFGYSNEGESPITMISSPGGILYGVCNLGTPNMQNGGGAVWSYNIGTNSLQVLDDFPIINGFNNGSGGPANLMLGPDGNLYGTDTNGGNANVGSFLSISTTSPYAITQLYSLNYSVGGYPLAENTILGSDGYFYTTTGPASSSFDGKGTLIAFDVSNLANAVNVTSKTGVSSVINVTAKKATVTIRNNGTVTLLGPIQLVVTGTSNPSGLGVANATGTVPGPFAGNGHPYLTVPSSQPHNILSLAPGKTVQVTVDLIGNVTSSTTLSSLVYTGRF